MVRIAWGLGPTVARKGRAYNLFPENKTTAVPSSTAHFFGQNLRNVSASWTMNYYEIEPIA